MDSDIPLPPKRSSMYSRNSVSSLSSYVDTTFHPLEPQVEELQNELLNADDYLAKMMGDLHLMYSGEGAMENSFELDVNDETGSALDDIFGCYADPAQESKDRNRAKAVQEIVNTEKTYVELLTVLVECIVHAAKDESKRHSGSKKFASVDEIQRLFGNVEEILNLHKMLFLGLQERYTMWNEDQKISDIFLSIVPFFKMYVQYMANYSGALESLTRYRKQYPDFSKFLEKILASPKLKGHQLLSLMILPIQRVPRYILLLDQLVHYTADSHPDFKGLELCLAEVKKIADQINESLREFEQQKKVYEIQSKLHNRPLNLEPLVSPSRWFVNSFEVHKPGNQNSKRLLIVLNDTVLLCKKLNEEKLEYKDEMKLHSRCWIQPLKDNPTEYLFHLVGLEKSWSLCAFTYEDQQRIQKQLESVMQGKALKRSSIQRLSAHSTSSSSSASTSSLPSPGAVSQKRRSTPVSTSNLVPPPRRDSIRVSLQPSSLNNLSDF